MAERDSLGTARRGRLLSLAASLRRGKRAGRSLAELSAAKGGAHAGRPEKALKDLALGSGKINESEPAFEDPYRKKASPSDIKIDRDGPRHGRDNGPVIDF